MMRKNLDHIMAFIAVAEERSFTKAAAKLGITQSTLSHTVRALEDQLGIRLLTRTTRSVSLTEAGKQLYSSVNPHFDAIEAELIALNEMKEQPTGTIRINAAEHSTNTILLPKLAKFLPHYPDIKVEISINYGMIDIVAEQFDAGVRLGETIANDMIAVRIGPDFRMTVVGAPDYFANNPIPTHPQELVAHNCINLRFPSHNIYVWEFEKAGQQLNVAVEGQLIFNQTFQRLQAALDGLGLAMLPEDVAHSHITEGRLIQVLSDWCPSYAGYHLYYPNRGSSIAFKLLVEALRYKAD